MAKPAVEVVGEYPKNAANIEDGCLMRWRGSVYKLIWREMLAYLAMYFAISFIYRYALTDTQQRTFEVWRVYFTKTSENVPITFILGFYVTLVVKRWWEQYRLLPWPDTLALFVSAAIPGVDERGRLMRRNIVRYAVLAYVITLKHVSVRVKKRFPTLQHVVDAGFMMDSEKKIMEMMDERSPMAKYWMPLVWATNIINRARKDALISSDHVVQTLLMELSEHRRRLGSIISYDTVCVPLVYTQVVTLSVYSYFLAALMGRQFVVHPHPNDEPDVYFPFFTMLQFCFYIGWLKVAEVLIGPFGEDDDDIELNWLIDRHIKAAYMIVDEMHEEHPELLKDQYWDEVVPKDLPYTVASEHYRRYEPKGSAECYKVKEQDALYANLMHSRKSVNQDDVYADYESVDTPLVERRKNWFQRQIQRVGSIRSSSTTYSSGLFGRPRHNSVYSSPDNGGAGLPGPGGGGGGALPPNHNNNNPAAGQPPNPHKMSIYDRLIGRKSTRQRTRSGKANGQLPVGMKNRPRIPTPDVTKESSDKDKITSVVNAPPSYPINYSAELPVVQVVLSPIQELEGHQSTVTSITSTSSGTAALAQAVLSPTLSSAGLTGVGVVSSAGLTGVVSAAGGGVTTPMTVAVSPVTLTTVSMSQPLLSSMGIASAMPASSSPSIVLTELPAASEDGSVTGADDRSRKTSVASKRGEVYV
ncbi:bestrophin-2 isoform X1 [Nilaparvata lugens]|uniref:bestrophin-2 isoform X1 n=1 Tax=Nilaparvata lugens TaxID=108931 RepID=UPI00193E8CFA|nr:bestrophin-2 isoform X1 [Nilaparvata lugens]